MSDEDFATSQEARKLADEIAGLKMMITLILKGMGSGGCRKSHYQYGTLRADAGR